MSYTSAKFTWSIDPVQAFDKLSTGIKNKAMRIAINAASAPVKAAVISTAPVDQGHLARSTKIRVRNYQAKNVWVSIVGAASSYKRLKKVKGKNGRNRTVKKLNKKGELVKAVIRPSKYQKFVDQGRAGMAGRHYLPAAFQTSKGQFEATARRKLREVIEQLMRSK